MIERTLRLFAAVRITGLTGKPELNGQVGAIAGERVGDVTTGECRFAIRLVSSGRMIKVKPQNLRGCHAPTAIDEQD